MTWRRGTEYVCDFCGGHVMVTVTRRDGMPEVGRPHDLWGTLMDLCNSCALQLLEGLQRDPVVQEAQRAVAQEPDPPEGQTVDLRAALERLGEGDA